MAPEHRHLWRSIAGALLWAAALSPSVSAAPACPDRDQALARYQRLSETDLKALYLRCARDSSQRRLPPEEAVQCSIVADVLKARSFGGDFDALLSWWRRHRDDL
jgi:hypothetical protein